MGHATLQDRNWISPDLIGIPDSHAFSVKTKQQLLTMADGAPGERDASQAISAMRTAIDAKLREDGVYEQIRQLVRAKAETQRQAARASPNAPSTDVSGDAAGDAPVKAEGGEEQEEEHLVRDVLESEVVQQLLAAVKSMKLRNSSGNGEREGVAFEDDDDAEPESSAMQQQANAVNEHDIYLFLRLAGGKAFVDQLLLVAEEQDEDGSMGVVSEAQIGQARSFFRVNATFQSQRLSSKDVLCCVDPPFDEYFRFRIEKWKTRKAWTTNNRSKGQSGSTPYEVEVVTPWEALCLVDEPVQIDLVKINKKLVHWSAANGPQWRELSKELLAVHRLDWRRVLCSTLQLVHLPVALMGKMKVPIGTLDFRADLLHFKRSPSIAREISSFLNKETLQRNTLNHSFYQYAKQWWEEYRSESTIYEEAQQQQQEGRDEYKKSIVLGSSKSPQSRRPRLVKLFAEDDDGRFRMVCKFLTPIRAPLAIKSPSEAARFVGLLPFESDPVVGGARDETWRSVPAFLSTGKGDAQDHAFLLASLLLGCGLDAYVCIGTIAARKTPNKPRYKNHASTFSETEAGHVWVLTRGTNTSETSDVVFWESVTGERFNLLEKKKDSGHSRHGYCTIDCVFNDRQFYANLQPRTWKLRDTSFNFEADDGAWKPMNQQMIADLPFGQPPFPLVAPDVAALPRVERDWTLALRRQISSRRRESGYVTRWSDELSFYLLPALNAYEMERLYGIAQVDNEFFQQSITRFVQEGHTFQGVPVMFTTESVQEAMDVLETNELAVGIIDLHARASHFGLAVRCFTYPEGIVVTWAMLAVSYLSTSSTYRRSIEPNSRETSTT